MRPVFGFVLLAALLGFAISAASQTESAALTGRITDQSGAVIPGAEVIATNVDTEVRVTTLTNDAGVYAIPGLHPGTYRLNVRKIGFQQIVRKDIVLHVQDVLTQNFDLPLGSVSETVTVTGGAPLVNTESATVGTVVDRKFVENMPLNGRTFQTLIALTPGVVLTVATAAEQGQFSVNGQRANANYFSVDGVSANIGINTYLGQSAVGSLPGLGVLGGTNSLVSVDAMQEFRVQTSSFAPEFGRTPGGQISIATRSGTNDFHGSLFDYFRNDVLDANNWFANKNRLAKPRERQNDFGGVFGGPLHRNRTFFFFSYEGLRLRQPLLQTTAVPDNASRLAAPPALQPFLKVYPIPNGPALPNGFATFIAGYSDPSSLDSYSFRIDHTINSKLVLFGRYSDSPSQTSARNTAELSSVAPTGNRFRTVTVGLTAQITPHISNELRANYSNNRTSSVAFVDNFGGAVPVPESQLFPPGVSAQNSEFGFQIIGAGNWISGALGGLAEQRQVNVLDNVTFTAGPHKVKFGADYRWLSPFTSPPTTSYVVSFSGITGATGVIGGVSTGVFIQSPQAVALLLRNFSLYAQDTWKAGRRIALTYGLRWDIDPAMKGKNAASQPFAVTGVASPSTLAFAPRGIPIYQTSYNNIAPRLGVACQLTQTRGWETVLRGGGGVFFDLGNGTLGAFDNAWPFTPGNSLFRVAFPLTVPLVLPVFNPNPPATGLAVAVDPNLKLPRTYQWNIALEQELGANQSVSATYVGATGRDLLREDALSSPNPSFQSVVYVTRNTATSDYNALQLQFQRRLARGLQARTSYTWSHSIDIASNDSSGLSTAYFLNPLTDRGASDFDVRHSFTAAVTYNIPAGKMHGLAHAILGDWSIDTLVTSRSALPVNVSAVTSVVSGALFITRPNLVVGEPLYLFGAQYPGGKAYNKTAFVNAATGTQGNFGRNVLRAFGAWQIDFAARRQFRLTEKVGLQLRAEFFNLFNHPNFGAPVSSLSSPLFGLSGQTLATSMGGGGIYGGLNPLYQIGGPRSGQLALKIQF